MTKPYARQKKLFFDKVFPSVRICPL